MQSVEIEFPCAYPIKVVGEAAPDFKACVLDVLNQFATEYAKDSVTVVDSRKGRFQSIRITIQAQGSEHLEQLHQALRATGRVQMVL